MGETQVWHGGDLDEAQKMFPGAPGPWIDVSTGINPIAYPMPALPSRSFERLPSPAAHRDLERAAAGAYGTPHEENVVAAPGTQVLISLLPHLRPPSRVAVLGPTYAEHQRAWRQAGHSVSEIGSPDHAEDADVLVVVNPNNPDGRLLDRRTLLDLAERLRGRGGWLVADEAFADFDGGETLVPHLPENAIVLRSFGKTYGLAGLRLGFAIAPASLAAPLRAALGPWAVSGPAIEAGRLALRDREWLAAAKGARAADARRLDGLLAPRADAPPRGAILYRLVESRRAPDLFAHLGGNGIWVRRFAHDQRLLRFGLPGSEEAWSRLAAALGSFA